MLATLRSGRLISYNAILNRLHRPEPATKQVEPPVTAGLSGTPETVMVSVRICVNPEKRHNQRTCQSLGQQENSRDLGQAPHTQIACHRPVLYRPANLL